MDFKASIIRMPITKFESVVLEKYHQCKVLFYGIELKIYRTFAKTDTSHHCNISPVFSVEMKLLIVQLLSWPFQFIL